MGLMGKSKSNYESDLVMGEIYREDATGIEGKLIAIHFYAHGCERGSIRYVDNDGNAHEVSFDAPELTHVATGVTATTTRKGGPARAEGRRLA